MEKKTYDNTNTGALFIRENEEGSKRPSITGRISVGKNVVKQLVDALSEGNECFIEVAGWEKTSKAGKPFVSVVIKGPEDADAYKNSKGGGSKSAFGRKAATADDDITF